MDTEKKKEKAIKQKENSLWVLQSMVKNHDIQSLLDYMWPKQLYGEEEFERYYDALKQLHGRN